MPQLFSSMALCLFRERPITLSGVMPRSRDRPSGSSLGGEGGAERQSEKLKPGSWTSLTRACAMQVHSDYKWQWRNLAAFSLSLLLLSLPPLVGLCRPCQREEKRRKEQTTYECKSILSYAGAYLPSHRVCAHGLKSRWFKLLFVKVDFRRT